MLVSSSIKGKSNSAYVVAFLYHYTVQLVAISAYLARILEVSDESTL